MNQEWQRAVREGDSNAVSELLAQGLDVDSRDRHGQTALMIASTRGHGEVVTLLVEARCNLDHSAKFHLTALMLASINGHENIVRMLCAAGADRGTRGSGAPGFLNKTARDLAEQAGRSDIVAILDKK